MKTLHRVSELVTSLYALVGELETMFPGRPFTPDGHLVGSLGEVMACHNYPLELLPCSSPCHDARSDDGRMVQVKATQGRSIGLCAEPDRNGQRSISVARLRRLMNDVPESARLPLRPERERRMLHTSAC